MFSPARSLSVTGKLTQLLGNSRVLLFIHQAESNVLIVEIIQNLGCKLDGWHRARERWGREKKREMYLVSNEGWFYLWLISVIHSSVHNEHSLISERHLKHTFSFIYTSNPLAFHINFKALKAKALDCCLALSKSEWNWSQQSTTHIAGERGAWTAGFSEEQEG